jgi:hypothetical protein
MREMLLSNYDETVVLVLKDVIFRHTEAKFLSEFLTEKHAFRKEDDKIKETAKSKSVPTQEETENASLDSEYNSREIRKYSITKSLSGNFSGAEIKIHILGELSQTEDTIEIDNTENYKIYNSRYQMIKIASKSGYAINQLIEQLSIELGLEIKNKEWFFHRSNNS